MHCVDAEGPMSESLNDTFLRLKEVFGYEIEPTRDNLFKIQKMELDAIIKEERETIAEYFSQKNLEYLSNWQTIEDELNEIDRQRIQFLDDLGNNWALTFFCVDHINYSSNPRNKFYGLGGIHSYYEKRVRNSKFNDEIQWHYHPKSISQNAIGLGSSFDNSLAEIHQILSHRILEFEYFPTCYRPGFHAEGQDTNLFLEQWIPFDFANQRYSEASISQIAKLSLFANWTDAPPNWKAYHPSVRNVQEVGNLNRWIFRCLNIGSRHQNISEEHVEKAFIDATDNGSSVLSVTNHDYRAMTSDIKNLHNKIVETKKRYRNVKVIYSSAQYAAIRNLGLSEIEDPEISVDVSNNRIVIKLVRGNLFSIQPYLAIKTKKENYLHDNLTPVECNVWKYDLTKDFIEKSEIEKIAIAYIGENGKAHIRKISI